MRDVGQPCLSGWRECGIDQAVKSCNYCPEMESEITDTAGVHDTCPIRAFTTLLTKARVGLRERQLLVDDAKRRPRLKLTDPLAAVQQWLWSTPRQNLLILGGTKGVGKTVAACYALSRFYRGRPSGRYVLATEVVDPKVSIRKLANMDLLVVDQLGLEYVSNPAWGDSRFSELVVRRDSEMLPTIFVGNLDESAFRSRYGSLVADRLVGDGAFHLFKSPSLRGGRR